MYSELTNEVCLVPSNLYGSRNGQKVSKITIHHQAGHLTGEQCRNVWTNAAKQGKYASANYSITDGVIALLVDEDKRSFASCSSWNDSRAITIEVANVRGAGYSSTPLEDWKVADIEIQTLIALCADICHRYNFRLHYDGTKDGSLTVHQMFYNTHCPGNYLLTLIESGEIEKRVNAAADKMDKKVEEMTDEEFQKRFNSAMDKWLADRASKGCSSWAKSSWLSSTETGLVDGSRPLSFTTREEVNQMIINSRAGKMEDDGK